MACGSGEGQPASSSGEERAEHGEVVVLVVRAGKNKGALTGTDERWQSSEKLLKSVVWVVSEW